METNKKSSQYSLIAAILFALLAIRQLFNLFDYFHFLSLLWLAGYALIAVALFMGKRDILPVAGFGALAVLSLISLFRSYSFFSMLLNLLSLLYLGGICFIVVVCTTEYLPQFKNLAKQLWYVPAAISVADAILMGILYPVLFGISTFSLWDLIFAGALLLTGLWAAYPDGMPGNAASADNAEPNSAPAGQEYGDGYFGLVAHILLLLFTGGIWMYIWIYKTTKYLNCVRDEEYRNPTTKLLLCMFVPFYSIYWTYKSAQRIDKLAATKGMSSELSTLCLILAIFVGIIPPILMQDKLNSIVRADVQTAAPQNTPAPATNTGTSIPEELKAYKDLLDSGVITQEEFNAKKKQLLDL